MTKLRSRRLLAAFSLLLAFAATGCSGGDSTPDAPAEDADAGEGDLDTGEGLEGAGGGDTQPAPGTNLPVPDPTDDLDEPVEGDQAP